MWKLLCCLAALLTAAEGTCDTNTLFFGDVNPSSLSLYQLQVVSALGVYALEPNNVSLTAYRHIGRPDVFLLREPTEAATKRWVIATLPDDKKPAAVQHAYEAWPEAGNIIVSAELDGEPWQPGAGPWLVRDCDRGRAPLAALSLSCVPAHFGQCTSDRWRLTSGDGRTATDVLTPSAEYAHGRRKYTSLSQELAVGADGRWRLKARFGVGTGGLVSEGPAERVEFVRRWRTYDPSGQEQDAPEKKLVCEPMPAPAGADPCATNPCQNGGTCLPAPGEPSAYYCRCRFDSVSPNCAQVRECKVPPRVANGQLLFTSDLSPHGKAFYSCDVGYAVNGSAAVMHDIAVCDGSEWRGVPKCKPSVVGVAKISDAYVHHCDFDSDWCRYGHEPGLALAGRSVGWKREREAERGLVAVARADDVSSDGRNTARTVARLRSPCVFVPAEGCVVVDVRMRGAADTALTVVDDDEVTLWKATGAKEWTTATLTLPPGSNRLTFEAVMGGAASSVAVDNVRVFQWNCKQVGKLLFPRARSTAADVPLPLLALPVLLVYSRLVGALAAE